MREEVEWEKEERKDIGGDQGRGLRWEEWRGR